MTRRCERWSCPDLEVTNPLTAVDQIRESTDRLCLSIPTISRDRPTDLKLIGRAPGHTHPGLAPWPPGERGPVGDRSNDTVCDLGTHRRPLWREEVGVDRRQDRRLGSGDHPRDSLTASCSILPVFRSEHLKTQITAAGDRSLNDVHRPWPFGRPQVAVCDPRVEVDPPNGIRLKPVEQSLRNGQVQARGLVGRLTRREQEQDRDQRRASVDPSSGRFYTLAAIRLALDPTRIDGLERPSRQNALTRTAATLLLFLAMITGPLVAQGPDDGDGIRFGVSFGGISTVALSVEFFRGARSLDISVGTWSFQDLSLSTTVRQYFGASALKPVVGAGLWLAAARPTDEGERTGLALVLRAPLGVDWAMAEDHSTGLIMNVNRGLWVKRSDPEDDLPMNRRLVPLPELYYRFTH